MWADAPTPTPPPPPLPQVLTSQSLATFTLVDCAQSLLGETLEVLGAHHLAALAQCVKEARAAGGGVAGSGAAAQQTPVEGRRPSGSGRHPQQPGTPAAGAAGEAGAAAAIAPSWQAAAARLARYSLRRVQLVGQLLARLATLPEAFEMARVTGLTLNQVGAWLVQAVCRRSGQQDRTWTRGAYVLWRRCTCMPVPAAAACTAAGSAACG